MATYKLRTFEERKKIEELWTQGHSVDEIVAEVGMSKAALYAELKRGFDGTELPNYRRRYNAAVAQSSMMDALARRGKKKGSS